MIIVGEGDVKRADELIRLITRKLQENRQVLERSIEFGRISWRTTKDGAVEINLEPKL